MQRAISSHGCTRMKSNTSRAAGLLALAFMPVIALVGAEPAAESLPKLSEAISGASAHTEGDRLIVSTGGIERRWQWTGHGLATVGLKDLVRGVEWADPALVQGCDWTYPGIIGPNTPARLISLKARASDDEGFTSQHLEVTAEIGYPNLILRYVIWAYPGANGIRSQIWVQGTRQASVQTASSPQVRTLRGKALTPSGAAKDVPKWFASTLADDRELTFRVEQLKSDRYYTLGLSWWDFAGDGRKQSVRLTSIDGEQVVQAVQDATLPKWTGNQPGLESLLVEVPVTVRTDGTATIRILASKKAAPCVSEIWLYESGGPADVKMEGDPGRLRELSSAAPKNSRLVAYLDAGATGDTADRAFTSGRVDFLPIAANRYERRAFGYYNDTQNRNKADTPVLREEALTNNSVDWASVLAVRTAGAGFSILKESHKCVNQPGVDTGLFISDASGLQNTGWGLKPTEAGPDTFRWCWASWIVCDDGTTDGSELALKRFDRLRYPVVPERDMWSLVCTWGHSLGARDGRNYASEKEVLREMTLTKALGVDMLLIDDGWQVSSASEGVMPDGGKGWQPHPEIYPQGWTNVVRLKQELGLRVGLWGVAQKMPLEDMNSNFDELGMSQLKLDFATYRNQQQLDEVANRAREFMHHSKIRCIMSWDTTERSPRYGYWWAREYGNVHFMNRKPEAPNCVIYEPWLALRDFWQLARYQNLNKWQLVIQNPEVTNQKMSEAWKHSPGYCVATALMGTPEFMAMPRFYSAEATREIRTLMDHWKKHREEIFTGFVFPIGDEPSNSSWTGFQCIRPDANFGYLMVFRELHNTEPSKAVKVRMLAGKILEVTDVQTGETVSKIVSPAGTIDLSLRKAPDFGFFRYNVK